MRTTAWGQSRLTKRSPPLNPVHAGWYLNIPLVPSPQLLCNFIEPSVSHYIHSVYTMKLSHALVVNGLLLLPLTLAQVTRPYNCINNPTICQNMCFWMGCVHPQAQIFTRDSLQANANQRRADCGATHCPKKPCEIGFGTPTHTSPDEFPFASMLEGGRTPFGDGSSLLCVPLAEQHCKCKQLS